MTTAALSVDDSASYSAGAANWMAVELGQQTTGGLSWFQNVTVYDDVVVPEPMTASLLALGGLAVGALRRRVA